ncbi:UDP-N-acetylglucosamine 4,6-dehydratase (inverting) [Paenibacillus auburnensis]|uniref:UDP-N-acetylglucosamine 4,6-dehydratase (Inverting) n=1 Tax=Paenibacillus auburnensis TaxID=2905649 RepID=A0ABN8G097_9BACL|nr:SDR family NAD(P)-dependent oxidoreductase [Paenibacillus auburnensis]CAH1195742.1 UDP-N-acetylglucosamine 4,6-dehydratase (inverting) [Paenibacillus auburnensis]
MFFKHKKILVIGGTGTIGKNIVKHILQEDPEVIRIFSRDEYKQFELQNEVNRNSKLSYWIGDIRDYDRVLAAMENMDYVFHTAAMKHVSFCEFNPYEAVLTNIIGTNNVIRAAKQQKIKKVVFTSTDKAISPTNNYGATKLSAEKLISSAEYSKGPGKTVFCTVRFGNVLGSRGSVIPLFVKQVREGKAITVTDLSITRFMMTLEQATKLTIQSLQISKGGETFILKMPVIKLKDLAEIVVEEAPKKYGMDPSAVEIVEIGLKPGEKRYEELMTYDESLNAYELPNLYIVPSPFAPKKTYKAASRPKPGTYSSEGVIPLTKEEVRKLTIEQNLI